MKFRKKLLKRIAVWGGIPAVVFATYVGLVWSYFQFERFSKTQPDLAVDQAAWYTLLNVTDLGAVGVTKLYPQTIEGRLLGLSFIVLSLGLLGVVIGKIGDGFSHLRKQRELGRHGRDTEDHVVIVGWDSFAKLVARELVKSDFEVVVVTEKKSAIDAIGNDAELNGDQVFTIYADPENGEMLRKISIRDASRIFLNCESDTDSLIRLLNYHDILGDGDFEYVVRLRNDELVDHFEFAPGERDTAPANSAANADEALHSRVHTATTQEVAAGLIASYVYEPEAADFQADLIRAASIEKERSFVDDLVPSFTDEVSTDAHSRDSEVEIQQYYVRPGSEYDETPYGDIVEELFELNPPVVAVGLVDDGKLRKVPDSGVTVDAGDYVIVTTRSGESVRNLREKFGNPKGLDDVRPD